MKKMLFLLPAMLCLGMLSATEDEEYDIEEGKECESEELCDKESRGYCNFHRCRHGYFDYYKYEDRDIDATWPGKNENSFMEELRR